MTTRLFLLGAALLISTGALAQDNSTRNGTSYLFHDSFEQVGPFNSKDDCDARLLKRQQAYPNRVDKMLECWATDASFVVVHGAWHSRWKFR